MWTKRKIRSKPHLYLSQQSCVFLADISSKIKRSMSIFPVKAKPLEKLETVRRNKPFFYWLSDPLQHPDRRAEALAALLFPVLPFIMVLEMPRQHILNTCLLRNTDRQFKPHTCCVAQ